ncbi:MAG: DUF4190 domain-containing protein [Acidimicrobiia bacterium]|nr:DUF4190 domain-containing protein [Acidimicrobiia bacterium]
MPPGQSVQKNDTAMFAMIAGILGVTVCALFAGIPAIILGMSGKKKAKEMGGEGEGQAKAGIILGWISVVLSIIAIISWVLLAFVFVDSVNRIDIFNDGKLYSDYQSSDDQSGDTVSTGDYDISNQDVLVESDGEITYSATIYNDSDVDASYEIIVYCEDSDDDYYSDTSTAYVDNLSPGDSESFDTTIYLDTSTLAATCRVENVDYS